MNRDSGHEEARIERLRDGWCLTGELEVEEGGVTGRLRYRIECDPQWRTRSALIDGTMGSESVTLSLTHDGAGNWARDGRAVPDVTGAIDVDLGFTPATNTLPSGVWNSRLAKAHRFEARGCGFRNFASSHSNRRIRVRRKAGIVMWLRSTASLSLQGSTQTHMAGCCTTKVFGERSRSARSPIARCRMRNAGWISVNNSS